MKAFLNIREFQGRSRFSTWLMRIVINEALMKIRKRQTDARHISSEGRLSEIPLVAGMRDRRASADPEALCRRAEKNTILFESHPPTGDEVESCRLLVRIRGAGNTARKWPRLFECRDPA